MIKKILLFLLVPFSVFAHGGDDDEAAKKTGAKSATYFSSEAVSDVYELLFKYQPLSPGKEAVLKLYVSDFGTNIDRKSTRLNSSHLRLSRMPSSA